MLAASRAPPLSQFSRLHFAVRNARKPLYFPPIRSLHYPSPTLVCSDLTTGRKLGLRRPSTRPQMANPIICTRGGNEQSHIWLLGGRRTVVTSNSPEDRVWITELKTGFDPVTSKLLRPLGAPKSAQHILHAGLEYQEPKTDAEKERAAAVIKHDGKDYPPIDSVVISNYQLQSANLFRYMDGLSPRSLVMECGNEESHCLDFLQGLKPPWRVEHLVISNCIDPIPPIYENVTSLGLFYCCCNTFPPSHQFKALQKLMVYHNDACDTFIRLALNNLDNPSALKTLQLSSAHDWVTQYEPCDTLVALKKCSGLETFELTTDEVLDEVSMLDGEEHTLATSLPPTVQHLRLRLPSAMNEKMPKWIKLASDPHWLPNLKTITFRLDGDLPFEQTPDLPVPVPAVDEFFAALKKSHPSVEIDQSWKDVSFKTFL